MPGSEALPIRGDARRLTQLFDNLLGNARRYTDAPGRIRLSIARDDTQLHLTLDDTSCPEYPTQRCRICLNDALYRRREFACSRADGGAGLGLAICHAIVEAHSGRISAATSPLGGLRIAIELPLATESAA